MSPEEIALPFWKRALAPLVLLLIVIGFFWKLLLTRQYSWLQSPDLAYQVLPWFQYQAAQFHRHVIPLWDPFQFGGQSLIGQDQPGLAYPLNWILFSLPFRDGHIAYGWLNWYFMSIHYFAALFSYFLCRDLGRGQIASVIGGVAFGLGGYVGNVDWPQMINAAIWAPLVFLFLFRVMRGVRPYSNSAFCGAFLGMSWLGGHHQIPMFLSIATICVWLYLLFGRARSGVTPRALAGPPALFLLFFLLAGAVQMWPTFSYGRMAVRWVGSQHDPIAWNQPVPYTVHQQYSLAPRYLLGIFIPGYEDGAVAYTGMVALALAGLALARRWQAREVRVLFGVGVAGLFFAIAKNNLFHGILYSLLPEFEKARTPATALYLYHFGISTLIAFGMDALWHTADRPAIRRASSVLLGFGAILFFIIFGTFVSGKQIWNGDDRVMITLLASFALAGLLYRAGRAEVLQCGIPVLLVALYLMELGNSALFYLPHKDEADRNVFLNHLDGTKEVAAFLQRQPTPLRVWTNTADVPFNFGDWYGIDVLDGFVPSMPRNFSEIETHSQRGRELYGAAYTVSRKPLFPDQQEIFRDSNGLGVYQNRNVLPRVWTIHETVVVKDFADARRHLQDVTFDLRKKAFFFKPPPTMEPCDGDAVKSFSRSINRVSATADMKCRGMIVMSENLAPGWVATIDGQTATIYEAYTTMRGVIAGPGTHQIEMRYRPLSVRAGAVATALAWPGALALWWIPRRRGKPAPSPQSPGESAPPELPR